MGLLDDIVPLFADAEQLPRAEVLLVVPLPQFIEKIIANCLHYIQLGGEWLSAMVGRIAREQERAKHMFYRKTFGICIVGLMMCSVCTAKEPGESTGIPGDGLVKNAKAIPEPIEPLKRLPIEPIVCAGHEGRVTAVDISPDGKLVVTAGVNVPTIRFWNADNGVEAQEVRVYDQPSDQSLPSIGVSHIEFTSDGKHVAILKSGNSVRFLDVETGKYLKKNCDVGKIVAFSISSDNTRLVLGRLFGVEIWQFVDCKQIHHLQLDSKQIGPVSQLTFSPDGTLLAAGMWPYDNGLTTSSTAEVLRVWDVESGEQICAFWKNRFGHTMDIAFSPNGKLLAAVNNRGTLVVWDIIKKEQLYKIQVGDKVAYCVAYSPDGTTLATGGNNPSIKLWNVSSGKAIGILVGHTAAVFDLAFSSDGKILASSSADKLLLLWPLKILKRQITQ